MSCAGNWIKVGKTRSYRLSTPVSITSNGRIIPARRARRNSTGCQGGYCTAQNAGTGTCWTDDGGTTDGTYLKLRGCNSGSKNQDWTLDTSTLADRFEPLNAPNMCMNDPMGKKADNVQQILWTCNSQTNEQYGLYVRNNSARIAVDNGSPLNVDAYCLTSDGNTGDGAALNTWGCNGGTANQTWYSAIWGI
jgi:hypothetical protein